MKKARMIRRRFDGTGTVEGAGVHCNRFFGSEEVPLFDPFLLLDDFSSDKTVDFIKGFPWHPHRGIETVTYILDGSLEHSDSLGNRGTVNAGDVQWMTAGSGIIHQEMPLGDSHHRIQGFQLWINLPADEKMSTPRYQSIHADSIPQVHLSGKSICRVIAGSFDTTHGPVCNDFTETVLFDISLSPHTEFVCATPYNHTFFAYLFEGDASFGPEEQVATVDEEESVRSQDDNEALPLTAGPKVIDFTEGDFITIATRKHSARFLLVGGRPLSEPVSWYGPIVMNTEEQLQTAFKEFQLGTFLKHAEKPVLQP